MKRLIGVALVGTALALSGAAVRPATAAPTVWKSVGAQVWSTERSAFVNVLPISMPLPNKQGWRVPIRTGADVLNEGSVVNALGIFVSPNGKELTSLDPTSGKPKWNVSLPPLKKGPSDATIPVINPARVGGVNIVAVDRAFATKKPTAEQFQVDVFDAVTGKLLWSKTSTERSSPVALVDDLVWLRPGDGVGAVNVKTGASVWQNSRLSLCSAYAGSLLCSAGEPTNVTLVDPKTGMQLWTTKIADSQSRDAQEYDAYSRSIVGNTVFLRNQERNVIALDRTSGKQLWTSKLDLAFVSDVRPLDASHVLAVGLSPKRTDNGVRRLFSIALADGKSNLQFEGKSEVKSSQASRDDDAVVVISKQTYIVERNQTGEVQVLNTAGKIVATAKEGCDGRSSVVGDVFLCHDRDQLKFLSLPGLQVQSIVKGISEFSSGQRVSAAWVVADDKTVFGLTR